MNMMLVYLPILALAFGYMVYMRRRVAGMTANARPAAILFFERTGYTFHDRQGMPPEVQADRSAAESEALMALGQKQMRGENYEHVTHYVRDYHGLEIHFRTRFGYEKTLTKSISYQSAAWTADLPAPPRVPIHIADKALVGLKKGLTEAFSNTTREFNARASKRVTTGVASVDADFAVWGEDEAAVKDVFARNPALAGMLENWAELDVYVTADGAAFNDPTQQNMTAAMGGMVGNMALGFDLAKRMELSIPVHDRVGDLLLALVRATA